MRIGIWAGLLAAALLTVGCGGSQGGTKAAAASPTPAATATTGSGGTPSFASAANCQQLKTLGAQFQRALAVDQASGANWQAAVNDFQALATAAPTPIRPDLQVFAHAFASYAAAIAKLHLKPGTAPAPSQLPKVYAALRALAQPNVRTAVQNVRAWVRANCIRG